jgi:hypothetical protein
VWKTARVPRWRVIALVVSCLAGGTATLALADADKAPNAIIAQTTTTPEDVGQDFGDDNQTVEEGTTPQALPFTGWRGRDAVVLGLLLLGAGLALRAATVRPGT